MKLRSIIVKSAATIAIALVAFVGFMTNLNTEDTNRSNIPVSNTSAYKTGLSEIASTSWNNNAIKISIHDFYNVDSDDMFSSIKSELPSVTDTTIITIQNGRELHAFSQLCKVNTNFLGYHYELYSNIDFTEATRYKGSFYPIGTTTNNFTGSFNGNGYEITSLKLYSYSSEDNITSNSYSSMFAYNAGTLENFGLINTSISQTVKPDKIVGVAPISGLNTGTVQNVYVIDNRRADDASGGIAASGGYSIAGFVYDNRGKIKDCYTSYSILVCYSVQDYFDFREICNENTGTIENVYFQDDCITSYKDGIYVYNDALVGVSIDESNVNVYGKYVSSLDALNLQFDSKPGWYTANTYRSNKMKIKYPNRNGLAKLNGDENTLIIQNEFDFVKMFELMNKDPYFASKSMTYYLLNDIDLKNIPTHLYSYNDFFSATFTGKTEYAGSLTLKNNNKVTTPTIYNATIKNSVAHDGFDCYGVFPLLSGTISNVNFYNTTTISGFVDGTKTLTKSIGIVSGYVEDGTIQNVNVYSKIELSTSSTSDSKFGRYIAGMAVGIAGRFSNISKLTTSGEINGATHVHDTNIFANAASGYEQGNSLGGVIGYSLQTNRRMSNLLSGTNLIATSYSSEVSIKQMLGGIVGSGYATSFSELTNKGNITIGSNENANNAKVSAAGIIGRLYGVNDEIRSIHSQGTISLTVNAVKETYISGVANVDLKIDVNASTLLKSISTEFSVSGVTNSTIISVTNNISDNKAPSINTAGMFYINSSNGFTSNLRNIYNLNYQYNASNNYTSDKITSVIDMASIKEFAPIFVSNATNQEGKISAQSCYNLRDYNYITSRASYITEGRYSGCISGKYVSLNDCRNEGNMVFNFTESVSFRNLYIYGLFETLNSNCTANLLYNGGNIELNLPSSVVFNIYASGICYENQNTISETDYKYYNPLSSSYEKTLIGNMDSIINAGNITQCNKNTPVTFTANINIGGIAVINSGIISSAFNLGDILNTVNFTQAKYSNIAGIATFQENKYAQIKDCANNGQIKNINMGTNGYVAASGIVARNDLSHTNSSINSSELLHKQHIIYTINYGEVISFSKKDKVTISQSEYSQPSAISAGILSSGILGVINTVNYANIFGSEVSSGMIGVSDLSKFSSITQADPVTIANSINYGNVKALYVTRTVSGTPTSVTYSELLSLDTVKEMDNPTFIKIPLVTDKEYAGSVIAVLNYNNSNNAQFINIRFLISFLDTISLVGNECKIPSGIVGSTGTMFTAMPNDRYLNSMIVYAPLSSLKDENNNIGVFSESFEFRKAIEGKSSVVDVVKYPTDQLLNDYFSFVGFSKINSDLLDSIGWSKIAYGNAAELFSKNLDSLVKLMTEYNTLNSNGYNNLLTEALNTSTWISKCDTTTLSKIINDILATQNLDQLKSIIKYLFFESQSKDLITENTRKAVINEIIDNIQDAALSKEKYIEILENIMYSDLIADIIAEGDESLSSIKSKVEEYVNALDAESLKTLAYSYLDILGNSESTIYDVIFTDLRYSKDRYELLQYLLSGMDNKIYLDILNTITNTNYSESALMVKALENMTSDEIKAIYTSLLSNNEIGNVSNNLVSLIKKTNIYDYLKSDSSNISSITSTFNSGISESDTSKIDLWNTIKHNKDVQNYLESKMGTVLDVNNLAHKGIYALATEYRNTYQSNDSPSGNTFTVNSNGTSTTGKGKYRATDKNAAIQTRYIYTPDDYVSNSYTDSNGKKYAQTYYYGPYVNNESNTLWNSSESDSRAGGASNIYYNLFDNTSSGTTQRYVPVYIDLDESHLSKLISKTDNPTIYKFMWNDVGGGDTQNQWVSSDIITKKPTDNMFVLKKNTVEDSSKYLILNNYNFSTAGTTTHNDEIGKGLAYNNVANNNSSWKKEDVLFSYVSASLITGIYYQQDQWEKNGAFLTAKNKQVQGHDQGYGVVTTLYIDYSISDLVMLDGKRTKGLSNGATDSDEQNIILNVVNNYLLNESEGQRIVMNALTKAFISGGTTSVNTTIQSSYFNALANDSNLINKMISYVPYTSSTYNIAISINYNSTNYRTIKEYLLARGNGIVNTLDNKEKIILLATDSKQDYYQVIDYLLNQKYGYYYYVNDLPNTLYQWFKDYYEKDIAYDYIDTFALDYLNNHTDLTNADIEEILKNANEGNISDYITNIQNLLSYEVSVTNSDFTFGNDFIIKLDNQTFDSNLYQANAYAKNASTVDVTIPANSTVKLDVIASGSGNLSFNSTDKSLSSNISLISFDNISNADLETKTLTMSVPANTSIYSLKLTNISNNANVSLTNGIEIKVSGDVNQIETGSAEYPYALKVSNGGQLTVQGLSNTLYINAYTTSTSGSATFKRTSDLESEGYKIEWSETSPTIKVCNGINNEEITIYNITDLAIVAISFDNTNWYSFDQFIYDSSKLYVHNSNSNIRITYNDQNIINFGLSGSCSKEVNSFFKAYDSNDNVIGTFDSKQAQTDYVFSPISMGTPFYIELNGSSALSLSSYNDLTYLCEYNSNSSYIQYRNNVNNDFSKLLQGFSAYSTNELDKYILNDKYSNKVGSVESNNSGLTTSYEVNRDNFNNERSKYSTAPIDFELNGFTFHASKDTYLKVNSDSFTTNGKAQNNLYIKFDTTGMTNPNIEIEWASNSTDERYLWVSDSISSTNPSAVGTTSNKITYKANLNTNTTYYINFNASVKIYSIILKHDNTSQISFSLKNDSLLSFESTSNTTGIINFNNTTDGKTYSININENGYYFVSLTKGSYTISYSTGFSPSLTNINYYSAVNSYANIGINNAYRNLATEFKTYDSYRNYLNKYKLFESITTNPTLNSNPYAEIIKLLYAVHNGDASHPDKMLYSYLDIDKIKNIINMILIASDTSFKDLIDTYSDTDSINKSIATICNVDSVFFDEVMKKVSLTSENMSDDLKNKLIAAYVGTDFYVNHTINKLLDSKMKTILESFDEKYRFINADGSMNNEYFINLMNYLGFPLSTDGYGIYAMSSSAGILNGQFVPDNINLSNFDPKYEKNASGQYILSDEKSDSWRGGTSIVDGVSMPNTPDGSVNKAFYVEMKQLKKSIATSIFKLELISTDGSNTIITTPSSEIDLKGKTVDFYLPKNGDGTNLPYKINTTAGSYELSYAATFFNDGDSLNKYDSNTLTVTEGSPNANTTITVYAEDRTVKAVYTVSLHLTNEIALDLNSVEVNGEKTSFTVSDPTVDGITKLWDATGEFVNAVGGRLTLSFNTTNLPDGFNLDPYITIDGETNYHEPITSSIVVNNNTFTNGVWGSGTALVDLLISNSLSKGEHTLQIQLGSKIIYQVKFKKAAATGTTISNVTMVDYTGEIVKVTFTNRVANTLIKYGKGYTLDDLITKDSNGKPNYLTTFTVSDNATVEISASYTINANELMVYTVTYTIKPEEGNAVVYTHILTERDPFLDAKTDDKFVSDSEKISNYVSVIRDGAVMNVNTDSGFKLDSTGSGALSMGYAREDKDGNQLTPRYRFNYKFDGFEYLDDISTYLSVKETEGQKTDSNGNDLYTIDLRYYGMLIMFNAEALPIEYTFNLVYEKTINWTGQTSYTRSYTFPEIKISKTKSSYAFLDRIRFIVGLATMSDLATATSLEEIKVGNYEGLKNGEGNNTAKDFVASESILYYNTDTARSATDYYIVGALSGEELSSYAPKFTIKSYSKIYQYIEINGKKYVYISLVNGETNEEELFLKDEKDNNIYRKDIITSTSTISPIGTLDNNKITIDSVDYTVSQYFGTDDSNNKSLVMDYIGNPADGCFWYVNYMVVAEDGVTIKNYHVAVIDLTNNIKFNFEIIDSTGTLNSNSLYVSVVGYTAYYGKKTGQTSSSYYLFDEKGEYTPDDGKDDSKMVINKAISGWVTKQDDGSYKFIDDHYHVESYGIQAMPYSYFYFYIDLPDGYAVKYQIEDARYDPNIQWGDNSFLPKQTIVTQKVSVKMTIVKSDAAKFPWGQKVLAVLNQKATFDSVLTEEK